MVVAFNLLLDAVVIVVLGEFVLLNMLVVFDLFLNVLLVVDVLLNFVVPFFSVEVFQIKTLLWNNFCLRTFVEQLVVVNVVFDVVLPIVFV